MDLYKCRMVVCGKCPRFHNKANILYNYLDVFLNSGNNVLLKRFHWFSGTQTAHDQGGHEELH